MKVLFVYPNITGQTQIQLGIGYLSAVLKEKGHRTRLADTTFRTKDSVEYVLSEVKRFRPDIIAFSCRSLEFEFANKLAMNIKKEFDLPVIFGGPQPTVSPETTISSKWVDMICIGEGEYALLELVNRLESREDFNVGNIWFKKGRKIIRNPLRPLIEDLDVLPFPDRWIFDKRHIRLKYPGSAFLTSRGCPFHCTYCINHFIQRLYSGKGKYTRFRSVDNIIEEMKEVYEKFKIDAIWLTDDTFTLNRKWLLEFCKKYPREIGLPFRCMGRCNTVNRKMLKLLRQAGCVSIHFGVETGNDHIRNTILRRGMTRKEIIRAFQWAHDAGLKTLSYNMIGIPNETEQNIRETIRLNKLIKTDLVQVSILYPFEGTDIRKMCEEKGFLTNPKNLKNLYHDTILDLPAITRTQIITLKKCFGLYCYLPEWLQWFAKMVELGYGYLPKTIHPLLDKLLNKIISIRNDSFCEQDGN